MPSRIDEAGHTKAFDYPVAEHWGGEVKERNGPWWGIDETRLFSVADILHIVTYSLRCLLLHELEIGFTFVHRALAIHKFNKFERINTYRSSVNITSTCVQCLLEQEPH